MPIHLLTLAAGLLLDRLLGEPRRLHPLVGFGRLAGAIERGMRRLGGGRLAGLAAWSLAVLPWVALAALSRSPHPLAAALVDVGLLYFALGGQSLCEHAEAVATPLAAGDLPAARTRVGWIVSRDTSALDEEGVARAAVESVLENGNDAVFGTLFWFLLLGGPGALLFRLANTLDAMWGYRTPRYLHFGWAAARLDDVLNYLPARLTALTYALLGRTRRALACWRAQAPHWDSPNAGPVMAAGAGALGILLGGAAIYHGRQEERPPLGEGRPPVAADIGSAVQLVRHGSLMWLSAAALVWLTAGVAKIPALSEFRDLVARYSLLPEALLTPFSYALPFVQVGLGLSLAAGLFVRGSSLVGTLLLTAFLAAQIQAMARGITLECGCFGLAVKSTVGPATLARDIALGLPTFAMLAAPARNFSLDQRLFRA
ncbi:MAG: cobalamin biosynthesis protein, partial [Zoogloea sp.]|nr:cobalamin biosynthesis protein [Zoogloea sp.]